MKFFLLFLALSISFFNLFAQNVGIGTITPNASAALDVTSNSKGFLPPRMTTVERNAITNKTAGLMIFNTTSACVEVYNGSNWINLCSSLPSSVLTKTLLGGSSDELAYSVQKTTDGGYIIGGTSQSSQNGDVTGVNKGLEDCWVVKLDANGNIMWNKSLGGDGSDQFKQIVQTADGGYILCATTGSSANGDVTATSKGLFDCWVVKLDGSGTITWNVLLGGSDQDFASSIQQTADGGYILGAYSSSSANGDVTQTSKGLSDYWIVKLNATGVIQFNKLVGGNREEVLNSIKQTSDGGYVAAGYTASSLNGDVTGVIHGTYDFWVVKFNSTGNIVWNKSIGGNSFPETEVAYAIQQTSDGGYIVAGTSSSSANGDVTATNNGLTDYLVLKLDGSGNVVWNKLLGGNADETAYAVQQTIDGGYIVAGKSSSSASGNVTQNSNGAEDAWIVKLDASGTIVWNKLYGGSQEDVANSIQQTPDGGYIICGYTLSSANGSVIGINHGGRDYWVIKLDANGNIL